MFVRNQETQQVPTEEVSLEVLLSNGQKVLVNVLTSDQTEDVLEWERGGWGMATCGMAAWPLLALPQVYSAFFNLRVILPGPSLGPCLPTTHMNPLCSLDPIRAKQ